MDSSSFTNLSSLESNSAAAKNYGKKKSSGGGQKLSTDPQSVAARQRRHRISNKLKILQSLVPGGSKMDTVSMLEEAIQYVKFLKTQIWLHQAMIDNPHDHDHSVLDFSANNRDYYRQNDDLRSYYTEDQVDLPDFWFPGEENGGFDGVMQS